jgi:uncharacterized membrane protein YgcG
MLTTLLRAVFLLLALQCSPLFGRELPALAPSINDFAGMLPPASYDDLTQRLRRFRTETSYIVSVFTVPALEDNETMRELAATALRRLPLSETELQKTFLLAVARRDRLVSFAAGADLQGRFPEADTTQKLQSHVDLYIRGLRPDLGIYGSVHFIFGVITGEFRAATITEEEALENASIRGGGAGAIFALALAPFLAFFVSMLLGIYSKHAGFQREIRLFLGIVIGGGTAQLVAALMGLISSYSATLRYFIIGLGMVLGAIASLTEYWMHGDWSGISRTKEKHRRKPEDNMGI